MERLKMKERAAKHWRENTIFNLNGIFSKLMFDLFLMMTC